MSNPVATTGLDIFPTVSQSLCFSIMISLRLKGSMSPIIPSPLSDRMVIRSQFQLISTPMYPATTMMMAISRVDMIRTLYPPTTSIDPKPCIFWRMNLLPGSIEPVNGLNDLSRRESLISLNLLAEVAITEQHLFSSWWSIWSSWSFWWSILSSWDDTSDHPEVWDAIRTSPIWADLTPIPNKFIIANSN